MSWQETFTAGETPLTRWPSSRLTASASPAVIVSPAPMPLLTAPFRLRSGKTIIRLFPIDEISFTIIVEAPLPIASTEITAAMPTMMPMQVRSERVLLRMMARIATLKTMPKFIACIIPKTAGARRVAPVFLTHPLRRLEISGEIMQSHRQNCRGICRGYLRWTLKPVGAKPTDNRSIGLRKPRAVTRTRFQSGSNSELGIDLVS